MPNLKDRMIEVQITLVAGPRNQPYLHPCFLRTGAARCPFLGVKPTSRTPFLTSVDDPKRTLGIGKSLRAISLHGSGWASVRFNTSIERDREPGQGGEALVRHLIRRTQFRYVAFAALSTGGRRLT